MPKTIMQHHGRGIKYSKSQKLLTVVRNGLKFWIQVWDTGNTLRDVPFDFIVLKLILVSIGALVSNCPLTRKRLDVD